MKVVYCANCGTRLGISRKALPKYARIIEIVEHHICPDEPVELDLKPEIVPPYVENLKGKFVQKLNDLRPSSVGTEDLRDRRDVDHVKKDVVSTAPQSLLHRFSEISNTIPERESDKDPEDV